MSVENNLDCPGATEQDGDHKIYLKEPHKNDGTHKPESYFLAIRVGSNKTPADYFNVNKVTVVSIGSSIQDPDDPQPTVGTWDWFDVYCPEGPPCKDLLELFGKFREWIH